MQRAAVSSASSSRLSPPTNLPPSKRQRLTNGHSNPRHSTSDLEAIREAVAAEDAKRLRAIERHAAELGETRWRLSVREVVPRRPIGLEVQTAGFAELDTPDSDEEEYQDERLKGRASLRITYGKV
jgi:hypothetical protein